MNKPNKCKNCQWYGKPYWSIINPCDNCPMENVETFTVWQDPTIEEKDKEIERLNNIIDELEKELKKGSFDVYFCSTSSQKTFKSNEIIIKAMILDKLKELKENK